MHDDQFTAKGPPFSGSAFERAAFSTAAQDVGFEFGVRALSRRCGVMGQTDGGGIAGIYGHGRFSQFGVLGTAFGPRTGVVGVSVNNTNDLLNLNVPPGSFTLDSLGGGEGTGVRGSSGSGFGVHGSSRTNTAVVGSSGQGFGVHGISDSNTATVGASESGLGVHGISKSNTGVLGSSESGLGVHGISQSNTAVVGSSVNGAGAEFESTNAAQVRLLPSSISTPEGRIAGHGGELLVTTDVDASGSLVCRLWLCTHRGNQATTVWELVAGSRPFPGSVIAQGSAGVHVKRIQMRLNTVAAAGLVVDGDFGPVTRQAVVDFQTSQAVTADGEVGFVTWGALFASV